MRSNPPYGTSMRHRATDEEIRRYLRSPRDLLRLIAYALVTVAVVAITIALEDSVVGFEEDVLRVFDVLSPAVERVLHGSLEWIGLVVTIAVWLVPLVTKRYRLFGYIAVANAVAYVLMWAVLRLIDRELPEQLVNDLALRAGVGDATTTNEQAFAQLAASFTVLAPFVSVRWRRAGMASLVVLVVLRFLASAQLPADVVVALPLGAAVGAGVLLAFGRPDHRPTLTAIRIALTESGLPVSEVRAAKVDARGSTPYFATLDAGARGVPRRRDRPDDGAVRQGAGRGGAGRRPALPGVPLPAAQGRRRRAAVLVAASLGRARGARVAGRPRRRRAHAADAQGRHASAETRCCSPTT